MQVPRLRPLRLRSGLRRCTAQAVPKRKRSFSNRTLRRSARDEKFVRLLVAPGATVAAAAATAMATITALDFGPGLVDVESAAAELAAVQGSDCAVSFRGV